MEVDQYDLVNYDLVMIVQPLRRAAHLLSHELDVELQGLGLTQGEVHVLADLASASGQATPGELHRGFGHRHSTVTGIVDRLERKGLVGRLPNPRDRRSQLVRLTPAGRRAARRVTRALARLDAAVSTRTIRGGGRRVPCCARRDRRGGALSDDTFLALVESAARGDRPKPFAFGHREHLRLAWLNLERLGSDSGPARTAETLARIDSAHGGGHYHETITRFFIGLVTHARRRYPHRTFEGTIAAHPQLLDGSLVFRHYSHELLATAAARVTTVRPDLAPVPWDAER